MRKSLFGGVMLLLILVVPLIVAQDWVEEEIYEEVETPLYIEKMLLPGRGARMVKVAFRDSHNDMKRARLSHLFNYDKEERRVNWVFYELWATDTKPFNATGDITKFADDQRRSWPLFLFHPDHPFDFYSYENNFGFLPGQLLPALHRIDRIEDKRETYRTINIIPVHRELLHRHWLSSEEAVTEIVNRRSDQGFYVLAGVLYDPDGLRAGDRQEGVAIPSVLYRIVWDANGDIIYAMAFSNDENQRVVAANENELRVLVRKYIVSGR